MNRAADPLRSLAASTVENANSGHLGAAMGGEDFVKEGGTFARIPAIRQGR